ncbi:MAG TPA: rod shape-determining protein MreD [Leeuwenhoekiella sp.]|nr:rod shape-determining protein MreD [Leeuwenhoekiella sp.]
MNNNFIRNSLRFILLILAQVLIFNHINFLGFVNPYPYVLFILLFPIGDNRAMLIICSFLLGITLDMFSNSGGMHAAASLVMAYSRPWVLRSVFGVAYEYNTIRISNISFTERFIYITILVLVHHFVLFLLETFNVSDILYILKKTLFSGIFTLILCLIFITLFSVKRK